MASTWESIASECQSALQAKLPAKWLLPSKPGSEVTNVLDIPRTCGLLSPEQLDITERTATDLVNDLREGKLTAVQVTEAFCGRAAVAQQCVSNLLLVLLLSCLIVLIRRQQVNCLTDYFYEEALERARELDHIFRTTGKTVGPLHGLPLAVKEHHSQKSKANSMGIVACHDKIAEEDSSIIKLFKGAGCIPYVRTCMPQTGMQLQTVSNLWGRTLNPFNRNFSAGGSSGGDSSLVAMHGSPLSLSTDIGAFQTPSIHIPPANDS